jgi:ribonuclease T1
MRSLLLAAVIVVAAPVFAALSQAEIAVRELPKEAREVLKQIRTGGQFAHERDGVVFGNREGLLPRHPRGYYHEYTVPTPGARNRGARRIVCGGPPKSPEVCYYTADHYNSFARIRE